MKASGPEVVPTGVPTLDLSEALPSSTPTRFSDLLTLMKARLSLLVIVTTFVGFCLGSSGQPDWILLLHTVLGTTLAAASAAVLNQWLEIDVDRLMDRTRDRPLPAGRLQPATALALGLALGGVGVLWLWFATNPIATALAAATIVIYVLIYTPMKRRTSLCTVVGAVSGAIPPMIGWTAARPSFDLGAWVLFGVLFTWQMPHFLAIAWMYRHEYANAGFIMIPPNDRTGIATATQSLLYTLGLLAITTIPFFAGMNTSLYLVVGLLLDSVMLVCALVFLFDRSRSTARALFFASISYLPLILGLMIFNRQ